MNDLTKVLNDKIKITERFDGMCELCGDDITNHDLLFPDLCELCNDNIVNDDSYDEDDIFNF